MVNFLSNFREFQESAKVSGNARPVEDATFSLVQGGSMRIRIALFLLNLIVPMSST